MKRVIKTIYIYIQGTDKTCKSIYIYTLNVQTFKHVITPEF